MINIKKLGIIAVIAVLFGVFIFSLINAFYPQPEWDDYCGFDVRPDKVPVAREDCVDAEFSTADAEACNDQKGDYTPIYENGCVLEYQCRTCHRDYDEAREKYDFFVFVFSTILGLIAIIASIYMADDKETLKDWILAGFLIGGLFAIFIGTAQYFGDLHRVWRPIIIFVEIVLVIWVSYKKFKK